MAKQKDTIGLIAQILVIVGGVNWGLVGLFNFDLVSYLFMNLISAPIVATIVYVLVGISALYMVYQMATKK